MYLEEGKLDNVSEYFKSKLADSEIKLPLLSSATSSHYLPPDGSLVRYRGMVQDQFDPEFYLKVFSITNQQTTVSYYTVRTILCIIQDTISRNVSRQNHSTSKYM